MIVYDVVLQAAVGRRASAGGRRAGLCVGLSQLAGGKGLKRNISLALQSGVRCRVGWLFTGNVWVNECGFGGDRDSQSQIPFSFVFFVLVIEGF